jgi:alkylation response protein AidB-like acyl-CoA dehydrogenase
VPKDAKGLSLRHWRSADNRRAADLTFENVKLGADALIGPKGGALPLVAKVVDHANAALCAEAVGAMQVLHRTTQEYLKTRKQFGRAIGDFQVLQHRMVDMFIAAEQAKSMAMVATLKRDDPRTVAAAKVQVNRSGRFVAQQAVQLHGGMGMTDELNVGHYFKRLTLLESRFGDTDFHLKRFAQAA